MKREKRRHLFFLFFFGAEDGGGGGKGFAFPALPFWVVFRFFFFCFSLCIRCGKQLN